MKNMMRNVRGEKRMGRKKLRNKNKMKTYTLKFTISGHTSGIDNVLKAN